MAQLFSSQKQLVYPLFGRFNQEYGDALVTICPLLRKFEIDILTVEEYQALPEGTPLIEDITSQTFANFLQKDGDTADTTRAAIIYNATLIEQIGFTEPEQHAAIAHEIGHMLYFFLENKSDYPGPQGEEIYCDTIASRIGLSAPMLSALEKLETCGMFPNSLSRFGIRKVFLNH